MNHISRTAVIVAAAFAFGLGAGVMLGERQDSLPEIPATSPESEQAEIKEKQDIAILPSSNTANIHNRHSNLSNAIMAASIPSEWQMIDYPKYGIRLGQSFGTTWSNDTLMYFPFGGGATEARFVNTLPEEVTGKNPLQLYLPSKLQANAYHDTTTKELHYPRDLTGNIVVAVTLPFNAAQRYLILEGRQDAELVRALATLERLTPSDYTTKWLEEPELGFKLQYPIRGEETDYMWGTPTSSYGLTNYYLWTQEDGISFNAPGREYACECDAWFNFVFPETSNDDWAQVTHHTNQHGVTYARTRFKQSGQYDELGEAPTNWVDMYTFRTNYPDMPIGNIMIPRYYGAELTKQIIDSLQLTR